jgi:hypothetical protein
MNQNVVMRSIAPSKHVDVAKMQSQPTHTKPTPVNDKDN